MGARIGFVLFVVLILSVGVYFYNTNAFNTRTALQNTFTLHFPTSTPNFSTNLSPRPSNNYVPPSGGATYQPSSNPTPTTTINAYEIPPGYSVSQLSPYFHEVRFGGISAGSIYSYGQISLYPYLPQAGATIDVTNWQIKTNRGGEYIPQAVMLYDPSGLAAPSDIRLKNGDTLYLYSTSAPVNLRLNKCMGYLPNKSQFVPQLPQSCPYTNPSQFQGFSGACQNYIQSLGSCQSADLSSPYIPQNDYSCRDYLSHHFSYYSCFQEHQTDPDFLSNEVRVWMGASPVDPLHDTVLLLDTNGLVVDYYHY